MKLDKAKVEKFAKEVVSGGLGKRKAMYEGRVALRHRGAALLR
jgi:hypothetical protein